VIVPASAWWDDREHGFESAAGCARDRGLGSAIARRLAQDGLAVAVNGLRDDAQALAVVDAIEGVGGVAAAFPADLTDERQSVDLVAAVTERFGPVDVLVVNATGPQPEAPLIGGLLG